MWNEIFFLTNPTRFSNVGLFFSILFPRRTCHRKIDLLSRNRFPPDRVCSYQYSWRNENCQAWPYYAAWPGLDAAGCCNGDALCAHTTINIGCARARPRTSVARGPHNAKLTRARAHMRVYQRNTRSRNKQRGASCAKTRGAISNDRQSHGTRTAGVLEAVVAVPDCSTLSIVKREMVKKGRAIFAGLFLRGVRFVRFN